MHRFVSRLGRPSAALAAAALAFALVLLWSPAASAQGVGERVRAYDIAVVARADGSIDVTETIVYDFGSNLRRGIFRDIYTAEPYDPAQDPDPRAASLRRDVEWSRRYPLEVVYVESATAPDQFRVEKPNEANTSRTAFSRRVVRIGDPDVTISGQHAYTIRYRQEAVVNAQPGDDELYWDIVGFDWDVPIDAVTVSVAAETGAINRVACFTGGPGSTSACDVATIQNGTGSFSQRRLGPGLGLTIVVAIPDVDGDQVEPPKIVREQWSLKRAFEVTPLKVAAAAVVGLLSLGGVGLLAFRIGRDRQAVGGATDQAFASPAAASEPVGLFDKPLTPVEFVAIDVELVIE